MNRAVPSLHGRSLEITMTVPFNVKTFAKSVNLIFTARDSFIPLLWFTLNYQGCNVLYSKLFGVNHIDCTMYNVHCCV